MTALILIVIIFAAIFIALVFVVVVGRAIGKMSDKTAELKKRIFLISPVRGLTPEDIEVIKKNQPDAIKNEEIRKIYRYVENLEKQGHLVHWPIRDTKQDGDPIGLRICGDNFQAADDAHEIHIWWNPDSVGSKFDFGIAFALWKLFDKPIILANADGIKPTATKSFENVLLEIHLRNTTPR